MAEKISTVHTDVDLLIELVKERKEVSVEEASSALGLPIKTIEEIADYLDEEGIISINYKLTNEYLIYNSGLDGKNKKVKEEKKNIEDRFDKLENDFVKGMNIIYQGNFSDAHDFYKKIHKDIKEIHKDIEKYSKDFPSLDNINFIARLDNVEHLLEHVKVLIEKDDEQRVIAAFNKINDEVKGVFGDLREVYDKYISKKEDNVKGPDSEIKKELIKRLKEKSEVNISENDESKDIELSEEVDEDFEKKLSALNLTDISALIAEAMGLIKDGEYKKASLIYNRINDLFKNMPKEYKEKKKEISQQIVNIGLMLDETMTSEHIKKIIAKKNELKKLMKEFEEAVERKDVAKAKEIFSEINDKFKDFPNESLSDKIELENNIVNENEKLLELEIEVYGKELSTYKSRIKDLIEEGYKFIEGNKLQFASNNYSKIKDLYNELPEGYINDKIELQEIIFKYYKKLLSSIKEDSENFFMRTSKEIDKLCNSVEKSLEMNDPQTGYRFISMIEDKFSSLPEGFLEQKNEIEKRIIKLSKKLAHLESKIQEEEFYKKFKKLEMLRDDMKMYIEKEEYDLALETYNEINTIYSTLPKGFLVKKRDYKKEVMELYKEAMEKHDKSNIDTDSSGKAIYNRLLRKIVEVHESIEEGEFDMLDSSYKIISELYNKLPLGVIKKNVKIRDEILKIYDEVRAYVLSKDIDVFIEEGNMNGVHEKLDVLIQLYKHISEKSTEDKKLILYLKQHIDAYLSFLKGEPIKKHDDNELKELINAIIVRNNDKIKDILNTSKNKITNMLLFIIKNFKKDPNAKVFIKNLVRMRNKEDYGSIALYIEAYYKKLNHNDDLSILNKLNKKYPKLYL